MKMSVAIRLSVVSLMCAFGGTVSSAREIHVAKTGSDSAAGSQASPYLTIGKAAEAAQPGDTVTIRAGTYREWVKPVRGGTGEEQRITYRAAPGDRVIVKGSEPIEEWTRTEGTVWKVVLPNSMFGDYNPYALQVSGGWLNYGQWHHCGDVYLNGQAFYERKTPEEVTMNEQSWHCQVDDSHTTIIANFGAANPNAELTEINFRECLFMPVVTGLSFITVQGIEFFHAAANWAPPVIELQAGAVGTRMGKAWIIENCTVSDIRCVGIILGQAPGGDYDNIDNFGAHIVRNNLIRRCGQAGIAGQRGATRCLIADNLIEETNYRKEFGGWETAAIKFHQSVDTEIRGNLIRGVYHQIQGAFGIWMDFGNQGTRITGNIIYNTQAAAIFLEMNHGPTLLDNNVVIGGGFRSNSENTVIAHNLLVDMPCEYVSDTNRRSQYFTPHTTILAGKRTGVPQNDKWYNNIFIRTGLATVKESPGFAADGNVYLEGADKSRFGDNVCLVKPEATKFLTRDQPRGAEIRWVCDDDLLLEDAPWVDADLIGVVPIANQTIEDRFGNPIRIDADLLGTKRTRPVAGPLATLEPGVHIIRWTKRVAND
jgi:parallel beta-helix repeat protein